MAMALNPWKCASILLAGLAGQAAALDLRGGGGVAVVQPSGEEALDGMSLLQPVADTNVTGGAEGGDVATVHSRTDLLQTDLPFWHGAVRGFGAQRGQTNVLKADYPLWEALQNHSDTHWQRPSGRRLRRPRARSSHKANLKWAIYDCLKKLFYGDPADGGINLKEQLKEISSEKETKDILGKINDKDANGAMKALGKVLPIKIPEVPAGSTAELAVMAALVKNKVDPKERLEIRTMFRAEAPEKATRAAIKALIRHSALKARPTSVITVATLNVGGDGPQPEYLGSAWELYGDVEIAVGAKILLANRLNSKNKCVPMKADDKFYPRYGEQYKTFCADYKIRKWAGEEVWKTLRFYVPGDSLPLLIAENIFYDKANDFDFVPFARRTTWTAFSTYLMAEETTDDVRSPKLSSLDRKPECKHRRAFPFFGTSFVEMYKEYANRRSIDTTAFFNKYKESMAKCGHLPSNQFAPLFLFDLFVLKEFKVYLNGTEPVAVTMPSTDEVKDKKRQIVSLLAPPLADVLFLQEAVDVLATGATELAKAAGTPPAGIVVDEALDTAILTKGTIETPSVNKAWTAFLKVEGKKLQQEREPHFLQPEEDKMMVFDEKMKGWATEPLTTVATTLIDGHTVLLVSQHPNSNGRPCVLYATLAQKFFDEVNKKAAINKMAGLKFDLMLVGMDANVMSLSDKTFEKAGKPKKDDPAENGFDWGQFKTGVEKLGFKVVHAEKETGNSFANSRKESVDTVHKIRTFLQSQFSKAAKVDKTTKDIILAYPQRMVKDFQAEVKNDIRGEGLTYNNAYDQKYPTDTWVLDHFATRASITIDWTAYAKKDM